MTLNTLQKKTRSILQIGLAGLEKMLTDLVDIRNTANAQLSGQDFVRYDDWLRIKVAESGMTCLFGLVVDGGLLPGIVARNVSISPVLHSMLPMGISSSARSILMERLPPVKHSVLSSCSTPLDLFTLGLPFPLPNRTVKMLQDMSPAQLRSVPRLMCEGIKPKRPDRGIKQIVPFSVNRVEREGKMVTVIGFAGKNGYGEYEADLDEVMTCVKGG